jgi:hypothetical protein
MNSKMTTYKKWIRDNYPTIRETLGKCKSACEAMRLEFPELEITNGFVYLAFHEEVQTHWWCKTSDGEIVDPTSMQYTSNGTPITHYDEITDQHDERQFEKAKCMNCGEYYYLKPELKGVMHNSICETAFINYLNSDTEN